MCDVLNLTSSVAIIDGMAEVQMISLNNMKFLSNFADAFVTRIFFKYGMFNEIHVVFGSYNENSLKSFERTRRQKGVDPVKYNVHDRTSVKNLNKKQYYRIQL